MSELTGKVAVVTGASSGIGRATAEILIDHGARVVVFARRSALLASLAERYHERVHAIAGDAASEADVDRLFDETEERFGACDILVNSAGMIDPASILETTPERWRRMFAVNADAVYLACRRALRSMLARKSGAIVNVASISGIPGPEKFPGWASYCASKGAVISFTEALAVDLKETGVRVNAVSPGSVDTPMWAEASGGAPAAMTPGDVAETILFLASDRAKAINGQNLHVFSA